MKTYKNIIGLLMVSMTIISTMWFGLDKVNAEETKEVKSEVKEGKFIESKSKEEFNYPSYNPTEPEIQLGHVSTLSVDEAGVVGLDTEFVQGQLDESGNMAVDGVKGKNGVYYVLEKSGDIISVASEGVKLKGANGSTVKLVDVEEIHGRNGSADKDGFKSNLVPSGVLPKTGLEDGDSKSGRWIASISLGVLGMIAGYGIYGKATSRKKRPRD